MVEKAFFACYDTVIEYIEADFLILHIIFMEVYENIIYGGDYPEIKYFCFHLFNDTYSKTIFSKFSYKIEKL